MGIIIFIVVIVALIVVHEFGHFVVAKLSGMRVEEFGLGYPPRICTFAKVGDTHYTLNWLPFGGFVKILGEDGPGSGPKSFSARPRPYQAAVLLAGIGMNLLFAYILITSTLLVGAPRALEPNEVAIAKNVQLVVASVLPNSPAAKAGLLSGDAIVGASDAQGTWNGTDPESFTSFVGNSDGSVIALSLKRGSKDVSLVAAPSTGVAKDDPSRFVIGVAVAQVGVVPITFFAALAQGFTLTYEITLATAQGLWHFLAGIFTLSADLSTVSGPIGLAGVVGTVAASGFDNLISLMAIISINLALINLIPIPALDGGRLLFVIIESVTRRKMKPSIAQAVNAAGFALLILLMVVVSVHDIYRIVG